MFQFDNVIAPSQEESARAAVSAGIDKLRRGHTKEALSDFDLAVKLKPEDPEAHLQRGIALMHLAKEAFLEASKWGPELQAVKRWLWRSRKALDRCR
jgi:Tfp pilus assembly protein PilF